MMELVWEWERGGDAEDGDGKWEAFQAEAEARCILEKEQLLVWVEAIVAAGTPDGVEIGVGLTGQIPKFL